MNIFSQLPLNSLNNVLSMRKSVLFWLSHNCSFHISHIYVLFFALPFDDTYIKNATLTLVDHGAYALCRHPGFWVFTLFYLFLCLFLSNPVLLVGLFLYTGCNFFYICLQDHYIFPLYIRDYKEYKKNVPFLLPTRQSIRKALGRHGLNK